MVHAWWVVTQMIAKGIHVSVEHVQTQSRKHTVVKQAIPRPSVRQNPSTLVVYFFLVSPHPPRGWFYIILVRNWFGAK